MFGGMPLIAKDPSDPVFVCLEKLATGFDSSTIADGTGAPVASLTIPLSVPAPPRDWPAASVGPTQTTQNNANASAGGSRGIARQYLIMANATISTVDKALPLLFRSRVEVNVEGAQVMTARGRSGPPGAGNGPLARIVCKIWRPSAILRRQATTIAAYLSAGRRAHYTLSRLPFFRTRGHATLERP